MAKIAWFGAGMMGSGFVEALRRRGDEVAVWNRTPAKAHALARFGAVAFDDPREAVRGADRVGIILSDDAAVDALLERLDGAIAPNTPVTDHTTVAPRPTAARFARCAERGIEFLHAPVFMGPQSCRDGTGLMLCSGPRDRFARIEAELAKMTGTLWFVGERPDKAAALKLSGNAMLISVTAGLADVFALAKGVGLPPAEVLELFGRFNPGATVEPRGKKMVARDFRPTFELTMARKDVRLMLETANGAAPLAVLPAIAARLDALIAEGHGAEDLAALAVDSVS